MNEWERAFQWLLFAHYSELEGETARQFSGDKRQQLAKKGQSLPDGSYPTPTLADLNNAIQAYGRAPASKRASLKRYLLRRARALSASEELIERIKSLGSS